MCGPWAKVTFPNVSCQLLLWPFSAPTCYQDRYCLGRILGITLLSCAPNQPDVQYMVQAHVEVVTGGSPRVFNPAAAAWYDKNIQNVYRIVNNKDIVPSLPPSSLG